MCVPEVSDHQKHHCAEEPGPPTACVSGANARGGLGGGILHFGWLGGRSASGHLIEQLTFSQRRCLDLMRLADFHDSAAGKEMAVAAFRFLDVAVHNSYRR